MNPETTPPTQLQTAHPLRPAPRRAALCATLFAASLVLGPPPPAGAAVTTLHSFAGGVGDGRYPQGSLTLSGSTLYGMSYVGGSNNTGTIFSMGTDGSGFQLLHSFADAPGDGRGPDGALTLSGPTLYGISSGGGSSDAGTIFKVGTDGSGYQLLHNFAGGASDGADPFGALTLSGSTLYGMSSDGGSNGFGTIFSMGTDGSGFQLLRSFAGGAGDGRTPYDSLALSGSTLYGMSFYGGSSDFGTIFSIGTDGSGFQLLRNFAGGVSDGSFPRGSLTLSGSRLYGMSFRGGSNNLGTIFSIGTDGSGFQLLHSFTGGAGDGADPYGSLTLSGSTLYGMSYLGGSNNTGTLFSIGTDGSSFQLLESFEGAPSEGAYSIGDLTLSGDAATLYGMTVEGGAWDQGTIFAASAVPEPATSTWGLAALLALALCRPRGARPRGATAPPRRDPTQRSVPADAL